MSDHVTIVGRLKETGRKLRDVARGWWRAKAPGLANRRKQVTRRMLALRQEAGAKATRLRADLVEKGRVWRLQLLEPRDLKAYPVHETDGVSLLNATPSHEIISDAAPVRIYDCRELKINKTIEESIEQARLKMRADQSEPICFEDEGVCFARRGTFEMKLARVGGKFLMVSGAMNRLADRFVRGSKIWRVQMEALADPERIKGRSVVFMGVGRASN